MARIDFLVRSSTSLKDKRHALRRITGSLKRFNVGVAEIEHQDLRQRGVIGICCVAGSAFQCKKILHEVEKAVRSDYLIEVLSVDMDIINSESM